MATRRTKASSATSSGRAPDADPARFPLGDFFFADFPLDRQAQSMWVAIRRHALGQAVRHRGGPYFPVLTTRIQGEPMHLHAGSRADHHEDHFTRGIEKYGALGYSLLRAQRVVVRHQWERFASIGDRYDELLLQFMAARAERLPHPERLYVESTRLLFWEALSLLAPVSEQVAALFTVVNDWEAGSVDDFGIAVLDSEVIPHRVIASGAFQNLRWWRRQLGIRGSYRDAKQLSPEQQSQLRTMAHGAAEFVSDALKDLASTWTADLHRVAVRYKHGFALLSASHGVAWGDDDASKVDVMRIYEQGGLLVADHRPNEVPVQYAVEISIGSMDAMLACLGRAIGLVEMFTVALLARAEHPTGLPIPMYAGMEFPGTDDQMLDLIIAYAGGDDRTRADIQGTKAGLAAREAIERAAARWTRTTGSSQ